MNFVFISPNYPHTYWNFCDRIKKNGINVLGIGDASYDSLEDGLKGALTEYYKVDSLQDYNQVYRAVAFFAYKYGKIDFVESLNEFWLETDAQLRTDFNVNTGLKNDKIEFIKKKSKMKEIYIANGIPTARQSKVTDEKAARKFIKEVGYPVIVKPDTGVGAIDTWKLENNEQLTNFYADHPDVPYVMEEFICGNIYSYDAIVDSKSEPLFENMSCFPPSIMDMVIKNLDLHYCTCPEVEPALRRIGRKTVKAFGVQSRFVHLEFFKLDADKPGLGKKGDFVALEVNMRPAGGFTPDMMNWAHSTDVYQIYADMIVFDENHFQPGDKSYYCVYCGRKDGKNYVHTHEEIMEKYGSVMMMQEEMTPINWPEMGRWMYTVKLDTKKEMNEFVHFCQDIRN